MSLVDGVQAHQLKAQMYGPESLRLYHSDEIDLTVANWAWNVLWTEVHGSTRISLFLRRMTKQRTRIATKNVAPNQHSRF